MVSEPDEKATLEILRGAKSRYEQHYGVTVEDSALEIALYLSEKYFPDRAQPTKALDLLDEACSLIASRRRPEKAETEAKDEKSGAFENLVTDYNITEVVSEMTGKSISDIRKELY